MGHYEHNSNWTRLFNQLAVTCAIRQKRKWMAGGKRRTWAGWGVQYSMSMTIKKCINLGWAQHFSYQYRKHGPLRPWQPLTSWKLQDQFRQAEAVAALFVPRTWRKGCHILKFGICWSTQKNNQVSGIKYTGAFSLSDSSILLVSMWRNKLSASLGSQ